MLTMPIPDAETIARRADIATALRRIVPGEEDDFTIRYLTQILATMASTTTILTGLLGAVAAVSLLVGGIGIMNIMLVSVTERTREIGVRRAVGASRRDILRQFLTEAVLIAACGAVVGLALGFAAGGLIESVFAFPVAFRGWVAAMATASVTAALRPMKLFPKANEVR